MKKYSTKAIISKSIKMDIGHIAFDILWKYKYKPNMTSFVDIALI